MPRKAAGPKAKTGRTVETTADDLFVKAIRLAAKVHSGQVDRFGQPFLLHVLRVATRGVNEDERLLGALHDVLERSDLTIIDLRRKGFPAHILTALRYITRVGNESYESYIDRVVKNGLAVRVKVHDLSDKMDLRNIGHMTVADLQRYNKQLVAYERLKKLEVVAHARMALRKH